MFSVDEGSLVFLDLPILNMINIITKKCEKLQLFYEKNTELRQLRAQQRRAMLTSCGRKLKSSEVKFLRRWKACRYFVVTLGEHTQFLPHAQLQSPESGCVDDVHTCYVELFEVFMIKQVYFVVSFIFFPP